MRKIQFNYNLNIKLYSIYYISSNALFIWPILIIFLQSKGLSILQIMIINSIESLIAIILQIPTGIYADKISKKNSIIIGLNLKIISFILYIFSNSFSLIIFASIFYCISDSFISGADSALYFESIKLSNNISKYDKNISNLYSLNFYASAIISIFSSILYIQNKDLPLIISILFLFIALIISLFFKDTKNINIKKDNKFFKIKDDLIKPTKYIIKNLNIFYVIILYIVFTFFISNMNYISQLYLENIKIPILYFGFIYFILNIISAISSKFSHNFNNKFNNQSINIILIYISICLFCMGSIQEYYGILILFLSRISAGLIWPILETKINKNINIQERTTILSIKTFMLNIITVILDPVIGIIIDKTNIYNIYFILGVSLTIISILLKIIFMKFNKNYLT